MSGNRLQFETSPYLLQHAHNPVEWYAWGEEALLKARTEDKPIILSIGYSACHWCHVMERESFEDENIAEQMNQFFVCIKVDREERPDIDQVYMEAVQAMGLQGGWPLNVILTPEGKPFYGGTYFSKSRWTELLFSINNAFKEHRNKLEESAKEFVLALNRSVYEKYNLSFRKLMLENRHYDQMFEHLARSFDYKSGGNDRAPKFPMPCVWLFLLRYFALTGNNSALLHLHLTLKKMALGGIYDQIGGGFARYSTDKEWFAPHFEKMLYDNAQLVSLYAEAFQLTGKHLYRDIVFQTIRFIEGELTSPDSGIFSALDADSDGEEGKFYIWKYSEIEKLEIPEKKWFLLYYNIEPQGSWEYGANILYRKETSEEFCRQHKLDYYAFTLWENEWQLILLKERKYRTRPGLDDKILTSWNGLMLNGLVDAYRVFDEEKFLDFALKNASFIETKLLSGGFLKHSYKNGEAKIEGYMEDYASVIKAFTNLYQATFSEKWLFLAEELTETCLRDFWDEEENLFFFTSVNSEKLIARKKEIFDNVIPSSNSMMAQNLITLGHLLSKERYIDLGNRMVFTAQNLILSEPYYMANWAIVSVSTYKPMHQIAISGPEFIRIRKEFDKKHILNKVFVGSDADGKLDLLKGRKTINGQTAIYICKDKACQLPVVSVEEVINMLY